MQENERAIVVHYSEIGLKGKNRGFFVTTLIRNIRDALQGIAQARVEGLYGRILVHVPADARKEAIAERLSRIPGIANFSFADTVRLSGTYAEPITEDPAYRAMADACCRLVEQARPKTFAVRARRADKTFPVKSTDLERQIGGEVHDRAHASGIPVKVDLETPDLTCFIELARPWTFVYGIKEQGPGGLPVGSSGRLVSLLSAGFDSPVASFLMMKRGAEVSFVHFHSHPLTDRRSVESVRDLVEVLNEIQLRSRVYYIAFGYAQQEIIQASPRAMRMILYRRMMMRIASAIARKEKALGLVTGESLGQVASQTLSNMAVIDASADFPVYRPLIGLNKEEIIAMAHRLGTKPISSEPVPDCCSLMIAKHPLTKTTEAEVAQVETGYDVERLVREAVEGAEVETWGLRGRRTTGPRAVSG